MKELKNFIMSFMVVFMMALLTKTYVHAEGGDNFFKATNINVNTNISDHLSDRFDVDWFKFSIPKDGYISLKFTHKVIEEGEWYIKLYYDNENEMYNKLYSDNYDNVVSTPNIGLPAGTYYIKVYTETLLGIGSFSSSDYNVYVNYTETNTWETEENETMLTADNAKTNTLRYGTLRDKYDVDWYKFNVPQNGVISVIFKHQMIEGGEWYIKLYYDNKNEMYNNLYSGNYDDTVSTPNIGLPAGTYYIKVYTNSIDSSYSPTDYSICVNYNITNNWETEANETVITADQIYLNNPVSGSLKDESDIDYYTINIVQSGYYTVDFSHFVVQKGEWIVSVSQIINGNNVNIQKYYSGASDVSVKKRFVYFSSGIYYICVERPLYGKGSKVDYSLTVSPSFIPQINITKLKSSKKKQLNVKWGKVGNITGYEINIATNKKFTKGIKYYYSLSSKGSYTVKKLKRKKKYYVRIRAYILEDGNYYYGQYSKIKAVKVK